MRTYRAYLLGFFLFTSIAVNLQAFAENAGYTFFVSPVVGDDNNPGTEEKPFATLERARDAIREQKGGDTIKFPRGGTVYLRAGTYRLAQSFVLDEKDSGTPDAPIVYQAYGKEEVRLSGGAVIPADSFQPITNDNELNQIDPAARGHVLRADLRRTGLTYLSELHWEREIPGRPERPSPEELVFDDKPMRLARWPNDGWMRTAAVIDPGSLLGNGGVPVRPGIFRFEGNRPNQWINRDVWVRGYWKWDWYDEAVPVRSIDAVNHTITLGNPTVYGIKGGARYYAFNVLSELDQEGEYFIDRRRPTLYFWPPSSSMTGKAVLTMLSSPLILIRGASYITIHGVVFEDSRDDGIKITGGQGNRVVNCTIRNVGKDGVVIVGGQDQEVSDSSIYNIGARGIAVSGGDRKTLTPANHAVVRNHIHHYGRIVATTHPGVDIDGVGIRVIQNSIHHAPHGGILFAGNDHVIELNDIHHVCEETSDAGAIYIGRDWTARGNVIRHNFVHNVLGENNKGDVTAIYLDDLASGTSIRGNILMDVYRAVLIGGGRDNVVENNVFGNCDTHLSLDARGITMGSKLLSAGSVLKKRLEQVPYQSTLWSTRYPQLTGILEDDPALPKRNVVEHNVAYRCGKSSINPIARLYSSFRENWETESDPGFSNTASENFAIEQDSVIHRKIPAWKNIPFGDIGISKSNPTPK